MSQVDEFLKGPDVIECPRQHTIMHKRWCPRYSGEDAYAQMRRALHETVHVFTQAKVAERINQCRICEKGDEK
jgi:hypothetical protein